MNISIVNADISVNHACQSRVYLNVLQRQQRRGKVIILREGALPSRFPRAIDVADGPGMTCSIQQASGLRVGREGSTEQIVQKQGMQPFDGVSVNAAKNRDSAEREGNWSRPNKAMNGTANGWSRRENSSRVRSPLMASPKSTARTSRTSERPNRFRAKRTCSLIVLRTRCL
jgi:hypothetical protein